MPYRSLVYRVLVLGIGTGVLGIVAAFVFGSWSPESAPPPAQQDVHSAAAPVQRPALPDPLTLAFRNLQRAFLRDTADLESEAALHAVVQLLDAQEAFVEVTWAEETLLLAESRLYRLQTLLGLWGIYEDRIALRSETGEPTVHVEVQARAPSRTALAVDALL